MGSNTSMLLTEHLLSLSEMLHMSRNWFTCCINQGAIINDIRAIWSSYKMIAYIMIFVHNDRLLFMMIYKPSKLMYSSVHIDRIYHFIRDHFSRIPLYTYISFNGRLLNCKDWYNFRKNLIREFTAGYPRGNKLNLFRFWGQFWLMR